MREETVLEIVGRNPLANGSAAWFTGSAPAVRGVESDRAMWPNATATATATIAAAAVTRSEPGLDRAVDFPFLARGFRRCCLVRFMEQFSSLGRLLDLVEEPDRWVARGTLAPRPVLFSIASGVHGVLLLSLRRSFLREFFF